METPGFRLAPEWRVNIKTTRLETLPAQQGYRIWRDSLDMGLILADSHD